jgi:hypothetical protein
MPRSKAQTSAQSDTMTHVVQEAHAVAAEDGEEETQHREEAVLERRDRRPAPNVNKRDHNTHYSAAGLASSSACTAESPQGSVRRDIMTRGAHSFQFRSST